MKSNFSRFPRLLALAGGALLALCSLQSAFSDTIYLKDGRKLIGTLDSKGADEDHLSVRTGTGVIPIPLANVLKIEKGEGASSAESSGDAALSSGNLDRAYDFYQSALKESPGRASLAAKLADVRKQIDERDRASYGAAYDSVERLLTAAKYDEAIEQCQIQAQRSRQFPSVVRRFNQMNARAQIELARQFQDRVNYPKAEEHFRLALQVDPDSAAANLALADLLQQNPANKAQVIPLLRRGIDLATAQPDLKLGSGKSLLDYEHALALIYVQNRDFGAAADLFIEVAGKDSSGAYPASFDQAVQAYAQIPSIESVKGIDHVIDNLKAIIKSKPENKGAPLLLGKIYYAKRDWPAARDVFAEAIRQQSSAAGDPVANEMLFYLGMADRRSGDKVLAAQSFQTLVDRHVATYDAVCELAQIRLEQASYDQAIALFTQARTMDREKYRAYLGLGDALVPLEKYDDARANYLEVVARDPENYRAQLEIGRTYFMETRIDEAIQSAKTAIDGLLKDDAVTSASERNQLLASSYTLAGQAYLSANQVNVSREQFDNALKAAPGYAPAMDGEGKTYQTEGRQKEACAWFLKAVDANPKNPDFRLSLAINYHKYQKDSAKALPYYFSYMELGGKDPNVRRWIADCGGTPPPGS